VTVPVSLDIFPGSVSSFLSSYVYPYLPILVVLLLVVGFASWVQQRSRLMSRKRALRDELSLNLRQANEVIEFCEQQKGGESYVTPIPRFYKTAYGDVRNAGNLRSFRISVREDLATAYMAIDRIDQASDRQEELLAGAAATSPIAVELRSQNLTFIRDTVVNVVVPRLERLRAL
jgi:hypothetical protein